MGNTSSHHDIDALKKENERYKQQSIHLINEAESAAERALSSAKCLLDALKSVTKQGSISENLCSLMIQDGDSLMVQFDEMHHSWGTASEHIIEWLSVAVKCKNKLKDSEYLSIISLNPIVIATIIATCESEIKAIEVSEKQAKQLGAHMSTTSTNFQVVYNDLSNVIAAARNAVDNGTGTAFGRLPTFLPSVEKEVLDLEKLLGDIHSTRDSLRKSWKELSIY